jgi:hypothetical protein
LFASFSFPFFCCCQEAIGSNGVMMASCLIDALLLVLGARDYGADCQARGLAHAC